MSRVDKHPRAQRLKRIVGLTFLLLGNSVYALEPVESREPTFWLGPETLDPLEAGIGKQIPDTKFERVFGGEGTLHNEVGETGTVVVVRDPECPVSTRYGPRVARLASLYQPKGFNFIFIYVNDTLGPVVLAEDVRRLRAPGVYVGQGSFALADRLGVVSTGDVFVLDSSNRLRYRGAVDDQYGFGYTRSAATRNYLRSAMDALVNKTEIREPATSAPGCVIEADPEKDDMFRNLLFDGQLS